MSMRTALYGLMMVCLSLLLVVVARALPVFDSEQSDATIGATSFNHRTIIHSSATNAVAYWDSFNFDWNENVDFMLQNGQSVLNIIKDTNIFSQWDGTLSGGDGSLYFVNPHGFILGPNLHLNVHNLLMTTSAINPDDFKSGHFTLDAPSGGAIRYLGNSSFISASGFVVMHAHDLIGFTPTTIPTQAQHVMLLEGEVLTVHFTDAGEFELQVKSDVVVANNGVLYVTPSMASDFFTNVVNSEDVVVADNYVDGHLVHASAATPQTATQDDQVAAWTGPEPLQKIIQGDGVLATFYHGHWLVTSSNQYAALGWADLYLVLGQDLKFDLDPSQALLLQFSSNYGFLTWLDGEVWGLGNGAAVYMTSELGFKLGPNFHVHGLNGMLTTAHIDAADFRDGTFNISAATQGQMIIDPHARVDIDYNGYFLLQAHEYTVPTQWTPTKGGHPIDGSANNTIIVPVGQSVAVDLTSQSNVVTIKDASGDTVRVINADGKETFADTSSIEYLADGSVREISADGSVVTTFPQQGGNWKVTVLNADGTQLTTSIYVDEQHTLLLSETVTT